MKIDFEFLPIKTSTPLILAVSGGPDSMGLLHVFFESGFKTIIVAHLDHQIRPESRDDAQLVKKTAEKYGYTFELKTLPIKKMSVSSKANLEAVGREQRYKFFRELKKKYKAPFIVTAHHADDQVETVLLNMIRGCGLEGLIGMSVVDGDLLRPLLPFSKLEIEQYCKGKKMKFVRESTNKDLNYRRNFLRLKVIPLFKKLNPNFLGTMENNLRIWSSAAGYFQQKAKNSLEEIRIKTHQYDLKKFLKLDEVLQAFVLRLLFEETHGHKKNLTQDHLEQVLKILRTNVSGKKKEFGSGKVLVKQKTYFEIKISRDIDKIQ
jgi:tRNA(Ile)-lysidine synthase